MAALVDVDRYAPQITGPRFWWHGPLPVETLVVRAVATAVTAANAALGDRRFTLDTGRVADNVASISHLRIESRPASTFTPLSGFLRCRDGWVRTHANYPHHRQILEDTLGVHGAEELAGRLAELDADDAAERITAAGGIAVRVRSRREWTGADTGRAVAADRLPWIEVHSGGTEDADPGPGRTPGRLDGLRVLNLTRVIAGPTGAKFLAALGADVLRIDLPHRPELLDQHLDTGDAQRSAEADLREADVLNRIRALVAEADVVLSGYRPAAMARFGLDAATLRTENPHLVVVELNAWGRTGPWSQRRGFDSIVQAGCGIADLYRSAADPDGGARQVGAGRNERPGALPVQALDHATGYGVAAAALTLLPTGGAAHLSLARTAEELFSLPPGGEQRAPVTADGRAGSTVLEPELVTVASPHGKLTKVTPILGDPRAPSRYGAAPLEWLPRRA